MPLTGLQLGRYSLLRLIGSGGMGEVYLAQDASVQRQVAVKVVHNEISHSLSNTVQEATRLFQREARAVAMLDHAHILPLFDYGEQVLDRTTLTYMVMPFREEGTLNDWLLEDNHAHQLSHADIADLIQQAASALQYAHNRQIIHQDVKPTNFLIRANPDHPLRPDLLLADFGIAKMTNTTSQSSNQMRGTPAYMAPEQWQSDPVPTSDQYSLAIMAYELLTGQVPFQGAMGQMMYAHLYTPPPRPSSINARLTPAVDAVLLQALAKQANERFPTISDFARALQQALSTDTTIAMRPENPPPMYVDTLPPSPPTSGAARNTPPHEQWTVPHTREAAPGNFAAPTQAASGNFAQAQPAQPYYQQTFAVEKKPQGRRRSDILLAALLLLLLLLGGSGFWYFSFARKGTTPSNQPGNTSTPSPQAADSQNPYPPHTGPLVLHDPLQDNSRGYKWSEDTNDTGHCQFTSQGYDMVMTLPGVQYCFSRAATYTDFAYEVQMTTLQAGGDGGLILRSAQADQNFYYFAIAPDGSYRIVVYSSQQETPITTLDSGHNPQLIHTGLNVPNMLAVVARGGDLIFYINQQQLSSVHNTTYSSGYIGTAVHSELNGLNFTTVEAKFSNARLWKL